MIELEKISKSFELNRSQRKALNTQDTAIPVLHEVSFQCRPGRITCLLGPNGAGKTTTLRIIGGILKANSGIMKVDGHEAGSQGHRKSLGLLTGHTKLYPRLTVTEMLQYFADLYEVPQPAFELRKEYLFDQLGIGAFAHKRIGKLSTGMQQKASIARAIIHDPPVVIFDEPSSGLDVVTAESIIELIRDCKEKGKTVLFSTHIMSEVDLLADDLIIMKKGKIIYDNEMKNFRSEMKDDSLAREFIRRVHEEVT